MAQKKTKLHRSFGTQAPADRLFDIFNYLVLGLVAVCVLYPLYFIVIASVSDPVAINNGQVAFWPVGFNTTGYEKIFENTKIWRSYSNTIFYTVVGTTINVILTMMLALSLIHIYWRTSVSPCHSAESWDTWEPCVCSLYPPCSAAEARTL